jgi:hypothetical protein
MAPAPDVAQPTAWSGARRSFTRPEFDVEFGDCDPAGIVP